MNMCMLPCFLLIMVQEIRVGARLEVLPEGSAS
jgi:hypothetical protein